MKKFTKLDEELIKELASSAERFDFHYNEIVEKINLIQSELSNYKEKFLKEPNNWGYTGSMSYVNENLDTILDHLNIRDKFNSTKKYNL